jgi:curved DNA-binding protein
MDFKDYYKTLGVEPKASAEEIKRAYRKLARKHHPDVATGPEAEARFKDISEAYEVLKDPEKRQAYDQLGSEDSQGQSGFRPPPGWDSGFEFYQTESGPGSRTHEPYSDFFESLFRRQAGADRGARMERGQDQHAQIALDIEDVYRGATRSLTLRMPTVGPDGSVTIKNRTIAVRIPKGITEGQHIRLKGQGMPGYGAAPAGDLFLEVSFAPHPVYRVDGRDLHLDLPITPWEAALGGKVVMPTPDGKVDISIPKNARSGQKLRLRGKGLPGRPDGDMYATLKIVNPKVTTDEARAFFERMAREMPFDPRANIGG